MKVFDVETFVVKPEKEAEFVQSRQRFIKYMKENPEKFKEMKSYKRFVQMWGDTPKFIEMFEFDSMADLEKYMMRIAKEKDKELQKMWQEFMLCIFPTTYSTKIWKPVE